MGETGCGKFISHEELAVTKLKEKYDIDFEVEKVMSQNLFDDYYTVMAYPSDDPDVHFTAMVDNDGSGIADNYVVRLVCNQISDKISRNLDSLNGIYYVYSTMLLSAWELNDPAVTAEQFMSASPDMYYGVYMNYSPENMDIDNYYECLCHMFDGMDNMKGNLYLYICNDDMLKRMQDYLSSYDKMYDDYNSMVSPYLLGMVEFENGKITSTKQEIAELISNHSNG